LIPSRETGSLCRVQNPVDSEGQLFYTDRAYRNTPSSDLERTGKHMAKLKLKTHLINRDWCKGCGICVHFCPKKVLELDDQDKVVAVRPQDCVCCKLCELRCPDLAIEVQTEQD
jgi:2-oxoglutarate ferredoxin oxidoreductase subunit delta